MKKKQLSVIIPVYNSELYLKSTLDSIVNQTVFNELEIILINDGSIDQSQYICQEYCNRYDNIFLYNQENLGVSQARNNGLKKVTSQYVTFLDSDDYIANNLYEQELEEIKNKNPDVLIVDFEKKHEDGTIKKYRKSFIKEWNINQDCMCDFFKGLIGGQVVDKVFRTDIIRDINFSDKYKIGEDMMFTFLALSKASKVYMNTNICGYQYVVRNSSAMTGKFSEKYFDPIDITAEMVNEYSEDSIIYKYAYAHYIHELCKVVEYVYRHDAQKEYKEKVLQIVNQIKKYSLFDAYRYLIKKQFLGFLLIRFSPRLYLFFHKIMHIG